MKINEYMLPLAFQRANTKILPFCSWPKGASFKLISILTTLSSELHRLKVTYHAMEHASLQKQYHSDLCKTSNHSNIRGGSCTKGKNKVSKYIHASKTIPSKKEFLGIIGWNIQERVKRETCG